MKREKIKEIVLCAILMAIIIVLSVLPQIGFISIGPTVAITIVHIPVLIGGVFLSRKYGIILGLTFGLLSFILAFIFRGYNLPFTNPLLSVLPRVIFGFVICDVYQFFTKIMKNNKLSIPFTMVVSCIIHSVLVLTILYFVHNSGFYFFVDENPTSHEQYLFFALFSSSALNMLVETLLAAFVGTPLVIALLINKSKNEVNV